MFVIGRRNLLLGGATLAALGAAGCGGGGNVGTGTTPDDMVLGEANAPVTMLEYGSTMCSHCRDFHEAVWETLKRDFIDTGKVRFIWREMLTGGPQPVPTIALAQYQIARCGNASSEMYFNRIDEMFRQQRNIFAAGSMPGVRAILVSIGSNSGLSTDQIDTCINDQTGAARTERLNQLFFDDGKKTSLPQEQLGTPLFFMNGEYVPTADIMTPETLASVINAKIAAAG
ncbi:MAG: thioredoxin domain-containing protein [Hyphomonadaceae bacterium]